MIDHAKAARIRREISTEVARSRLRTTQAPPTRPVEPLIDISDANPFEPVSTTLRTFSDSNPFVSQRKHESGQAWWNDGGPIRRQNEIITTGKNPFRDEKIAALSRPNDWVAFD